MDDIESLKKYFARWKNARGEWPQSNKMKLEDVIEWTKMPKSPYQRIARILRRLVDLNVFTVAHASAIPDSGIMMMDGVGKVSARVLRKALAEHVQMVSSKKRATAPKKTEATDPKPKKEEEEEPVDPSPTDEEAQEVERITRILTYVENPTSLVTRGSPYSGPFSVDMRFHRHAPLPTIQIIDSRGRKATVRLKMQLDEKNNPMLCIDAKRGEKWTIGLEFKDNLGYE
jgi:hypothetical protein